MRVIIAGGRDFDYYPYLDEKVHAFDEEITQIVSGGARGADSLGERWAEENLIEIKRFIPEWDRLGKGAGFKRNIDMAIHSDVLIAFWDGQSKGTKHMIDTALKYKLQTHVYLY